MDHLRYYLVAFLFLITTNSASASVTDALRLVSLAWQLPTVPERRLAERSARMKHCPPRLSRSMTRLLFMFHQRQVRSYVISYFICKAFAASAATQELHPPT